jgi:hypothetical protein
MTDIDIAMTDNTMTDIAMTDIALNAVARGDLARGDARRDIAIATWIAQAMSARPPLPAGQGLPQT